MTQDGFFLSALVALGVAVKPPILVHDQTSATAEREERPSPAEHHEKPIAKACQKENVDDQPNQPRKETGQLQLTNFSNRSAPTDRRHLALVDVLEFCPGRLSDIIENRIGDKATLLRCDRSLAGQLFTCCLLYTSPSPRDATLSRMPSSA